VAIKNTIKRWRAWAKRLKVEIYALYLAYQDPRVPWYGKALAALVVAYAFSPIDLIPDFIPVLGYLDDLVLVPLGVMLALRMVPEPIMKACRESAQELLEQERPQSWVAAGFIVAFWVLSAALVAILVL